MIIRLSWLLAAVLFALPGAAQTTVETADAACARCHSAISASYLQTPKAHASGLAVDHLLPGEFTAAASGVHYAVSQSKGPGGASSAWLSFSDPRNENGRGQQQLQYFLGSGHLGVTYLYTQDGFLLESPVAWYAATASYDLKPGFGSLPEMPPAIPMEPACLRCHMSGVAHAEPGTLNRFAGLPFQQGGITCEACHGDAAAHVRSGGKAAVINPAKLDADRRDSICISCHLEGDITVPRAGRSALDWKPGERISDYLSYFVLRDKGLLNRSVSEVEQLSTSRCKQASGDRMSCTSCHDPHSRPAPEQRAAFYRGKCLACHGAPEFARTHHPEQTDCAACHMPRASAEDIPHVAWTDHRILRRPELPGTGQAVSGAGVLTAIFSPQADGRDLAVAAYQAVMNGQSRDRTGALGQLRAAYATGARDPSVLEGMGVLAGLGGDEAESEKRFREVLAQDPTQLTAGTDLGVLLARKGQLQAAVDLWKPLLARNPDLIELARDLATVQCALHDDAGAEKTMADALRFSPGVRGAWGFHCPSPSTIH